MVEETQIRLEYANKKSGHSWKEHLVLFALYQQIDQESDGEDDNEVAYESRSV